MPVTSAMQPVGGTWGGWMAAPQGYRMVVPASHPTLSTPHVSTQQAPQPQGNTVPPFGQITDSAQQFLHQRELEASSAGSHMVNEGIIQRWHQLMEYIGHVRNARPSTSEQQHKAADLYKEFFTAFSALAHSVAMRAPTLESGDEFGAGVQAGVVSSIGSVLDSADSKYAQMMAILQQILHVEVKYGSASNKQAYETLMHALTTKFNMTHDMLISHMADCYVQMLHAVSKNFKLIAQPKSQGHAPLWT